jgi:hypothetical protein
VRSTIRIVASLSYCAALSSAIGLPLVGPTNAAPISAAAPFLWLNNKGPNTIAVGSGLLIAVGDGSVIPNGSAGTTAIAQTVNLTTGTTLSIAVPFQGLTVAPNQFGTNVAYNANLLGPWTLTFANGPDTTSVTTGSLIGAPLVPFATGVTVSGSQSNPTFSWTYPTDSVDAIRVNIYDRTLQAANGATDQVYASLDIPGNAGSFTIPNVLAGGLSLITNHEYTADIQANLLRDKGLPSSNSNLLSVSQEFFDFVPSQIGAVPEPSSMLLIGSSITILLCSRRPRGAATRKEQLMLPVAPGSRPNAV